MLEAEEKAKKLNSTAYISLICGILAWALATTGCPADCGSDWSILWNKSTEICQEENGDSGISVECYYGGFDRYDLDLMK